MHEARQSPGSHPAGRPCHARGRVYSTNMAHTNEQASAQGFDRKWALFFLATMLLVVGAFLVQRFVFAPAGVESNSAPAGSEQVQPHTP